jgi:hypothetical protein
MNRREFLEILGIGAVSLILPSQYSDADPIDAPSVFYNRRNKKFWHCTFGDLGSFYATLRRDTKNKVWRFSGCTVYAGEKFPISATIVRDSGQLLKLGVAPGGVCRWQSALGDEIIFPKRSVIGVRLDSNKGRWGTETLRL